MTGSEGHRLAGKVAVVTGAASGIGEAAARRFVGQGATVIVADIQGEAGQALAGDLGEPARAIHCDVTEEADIAAAVDLAIETWGRLDVMFNNAGIVGVSGPIADTPTEAWDTTISILLRAVFLGMKHAARVMVPQGSGSIVSTSSTAGILGGLGPHAYTAAKHGVIGLTKSVANELAAAGIRVNAISPGSTVTPLLAAVFTGDPQAVDEVEKRMGGATPLGFATTAEDIADAVLYLAGDESRSITGHTLVVDAGYTTAGTAVSPFHTGQPTLHRHAGLREQP